MTFTLLKLFDTSWHPNVSLRVEINVAAGGLDTLASTFRMKLWGRRKGDEKGLLLSSWLMIIGDDIVSEMTWLTWYWGCVSGEVCLGSSWARVLERVFIITRVCLECDDGNEMLWSEIRSTQCFGRRGEEVRLTAKVFLGCVEEACCEIEGSQ